MGSSLVAAYIPPSLSVHWNTLPWDLGLVRKVIGRIYTDPCSNSGSIVDAVLSYTAEDNGLAWPWLKNFFCNPPFGNLVPLFFHRALGEIENGNCFEGIFLVPARVDTRWFHAFAMQSDGICFVKGRRKFSQVDSDTESEASAPFPVIFIYFGPHGKRFREVFEEEIDPDIGRSVGAIWTPSRKQRLNARKQRAMLRLMSDEVDSELMENIQLAKGLGAFIRKIAKEVVSDELDAREAKKAKKKGKKKVAKKKGTKKKGKKKADKKPADE